MGAASALALLFHPAQAEWQPAPSTALISQSVIDSVREAATRQIVIMSIQSQNHSFGDLSQGEIDRLDGTWRKQTVSENQPLIAAKMSNPLSAYLTRIQALSLGLYAEIFVMDANGLNVGQSNVTSDFWQGDEAKFQKTFSVAPDAVFIDEAELNEDTNTYRAQLNIAIADPNTGEAIGAATFEINLTELQRRSSQS